jgi:hypothetical protein
VVSSIDDEISISLADIASKNARDYRLDMTKSLKKKRAEIQALKSDYDLEDKLMLKSFQIAELLMKDIEAKAKEKADFRIKFFEDQKKIRNENRSALISSKGIEGIWISRYSEMEDSTFDIFLAGLVSIKEKEEEDEKQRLKLEAENNLRSMEAEEIKANNEVYDYHNDEAKTSPLSYISPPEGTDSKSILSWVERFSVPYTSINNEKTKLIRVKHEAFKSWARKIAGE